MIKKRGFSLIELCVVLALCSCMMFLGMHFFDAQQRMIVRVELDALYALFMSLAQRAVMTKRDQVITCDMINNTYWVHGEKRSLVGAIFGTPDNIKGPPSSPTQSIHNPISFTGQKIVFFANGKIQPGTLYLTDHKRRVAYALSCPIAQFSYIRRYIYRSGWEAI